MDRIKMREKLEKKLDTHRYEHSVGVSYTAAAMAMKHGVSPEKAAVAGLLHDCAKCTPNKLKKCRKHNLPVNKFEEKNPELLHAKLSALYARMKYDVTDEDILGAITWHTTGKANMTDLEKIVYIADYIEPNRKELPEMAQIREEAFTDLDVCLVHILKSTLDYLMKKDNNGIDPITLETYEYYVKQESHIGKGE